MAEPIRAPNPLDLPEILEQVLSFLASDRPTLAAAIRVNQRWFDLATPLLWNGRRWDAVEALGAHRLPVYASRMKRLLFWHAAAPGSDPATYYAHITMTPEESEAAGRPVTRQLFGPSIRAVSLRNAVDDAFLDAVAAGCANLRSVWVRGNSLSTFTAAGLDRLLARHSGALQEFGMSPRFSPEETGEILVRLASMPELRILQLQTVRCEDALKRILKTVSSPFRRVRRLESNTASLAVPLLLRCFRGITELHLHIQGREGVLRPIAALYSIRSLELYPDGEGVMFADDDIMALKQLDKLEVLKIYDDVWAARAATKESDNPHDEGGHVRFSSKPFDELMSCIGRRLTTLEFCIACTIPDALAIVGKHCPRLKSLAVRESCCEVPGPRFGPLPPVMCPELVELAAFSVGSNDPTLWPPVQALHLRAAAPKLRQIVLTDVLGTNSPVGNAFMQLVGSSVGKPRYNSMHYGCRKYRCGITVYKNPDHQRGVTSEKFPGYYSDGGT